jgi:signal transduction histidine kinase
VRAVRGAGKEALGELRRQLGLMRAGEPTSVSPLPGLAQLSELAASSGARLTMARDLTGEPSEELTDVLTDDLADVPPGLGLTTYRLVQEALTNAQRHAPGASVEVCVRRTGGELVVSVQDDGPGASASVGSGQGLVGMEERVAMYGGVLDVGPRTDRPGWRVRARLPIVVGAETS